MTIGVKSTFDLIEDPIQTENSDGTYTTRYLAKLSAPASRLIVQAQGSNLLSLDISRPASNGVSSTMKSEVRKWSDQNTITESFASPSGTYQISVVSKDKEIPRIAQEIEQ